jgi:hypothetical protein
MAASPSMGWTAASLLPNLAAHLSGMSAPQPSRSPVPVMGKPYAPAAPDQTPAATAFRNSLVNQITGNQQKQPQPLAQMIPKSPGTNPAVNNLSDIGFQYPSLLSKI